MLGTAKQRHVAARRRCGRRFAFGKDLTGCASAMHNPFLLSEGRHGRAVDLYLTSDPNMVDLRSIVGGRQYRDIR
jgi:hypothetical protein